LFDQLTRFSSIFRSLSRAQRPGAPFFPVVQDSLVSARSHQGSSEHVAAGCGTSLRRPRLGGRPDPTCAATLIRSSGGCSGRPLRFVPHAVFWRPRSACPTICMNASLGPRLTAGELLQSDKGRSIPHASFDVVQARSRSGAARLHPEPSEYRHHEATPRRVPVPPARCPRECRQPSNDRTPNPVLTWETVAPLPKCHDSMHEYAFDRTFP